MFNANLCSETYLEPSLLSMMEFFSLQLCHILKTLNSIELPLSSIFYTTHPFMKNLTTLLLKESFVNNETFFFQNSKLHNEMAPSINRSSHWRCSIRKDVLRNFAKSTRKHLYQSLFLNKVAGLRLWCRCFSVNFAKFLRTPFLPNTSGWLLLNKGFLN